MFTIDSTFSRANIPKTIRFTEDLDTKLSTLSHGENISFNELVLRCCQYALENYDGNVDINSVRNKKND